MVFEKVFDLLSHQGNKSKNCFETSWYRNQNVYHQENQ